MTRVMRFSLAAGFCCSLFLLSCAPGQDGSDPPATATNEHTLDSAQTAFANLSKAPFEQPLPEELHLVVLTAVETDQGFVVELIDPSLTDADAGTGLVATYLLYRPDTDREAVFREAMEGLHEGDASPTALATEVDTTCLLLPTRARCVTGTDAYLVETAYLPADAVSDMRTFMEDITGAVIDHYQAHNQ